MSSFTTANPDEVGVFQLLTSLSSKVARKYTSQSKLPQKYVASKMRSCAYEIILKKSLKEVNCLKSEPIINLLSYYLKIAKNAKNVAEYKRLVTLKKMISQIRQTDYGDTKDDFYSVLRFIVALNDSIKEDYALELFQKPFSFGLLDEMAPKPPPEDFGSPQPYPYYPAHIFELPFSFKRADYNLDELKSQTYTEYSVESFDCKLLPSDNRSQRYGSLDSKNYHSPISIASLASSKVSPYTESSVWNLPRLTAPRDLQFLPAHTNETQVKVSIPSSDTNTEVQEVFRMDSGANKRIIDIWEIATQIDKEVPNDIWDVVCCIPPGNERQLICDSLREMALWHKMNDGALSDLQIITETLFIKHIKYLLIGVETSSFPFSQESNCFYMKPDLMLEGISKVHLASYVNDLLLIGTYYKRLYQFAFNHALEDNSNGQVYEAARGVVRRYLLEFRMTATSIYEDSCRPDSESARCLPTLLQILYHIEPLKYEIETVVSIYKLLDPVADAKSSLPCGAGLMSYLFNEMSLVTHETIAHTVFNYLYSICSIYFKFIEKFIFEGELDDRYNEFFIRKDKQCVKNRSKRYWDKGFYLTQSQAVPEFLRPLAKRILLCGKSLRLIKHCHPSDPLVLLISSDHPSVKCCTNFEELEQQQRVLDVYRTRCLFVSGEPMSFEQILLNREAERKAFAEMASIKQAETLEKIVAERKRLAQLIIAEKQHSLRVLEAAMAETEAAKKRAKARDRRRTELEKQADRAAEEVDSKLCEHERDKIMDYYTKLNMEVEKSKIHTEWKMKRLQLDQSRMQLLSTEERNLKREKLELEHQRNEEIMAISIQSMDMNSDDKVDVIGAVDIKPNSMPALGVTKSNPDISSTNTELFKRPSVPVIIDEPSKNKEAEIKSKTDMFSAICSVAKSVFGVTKRWDDTKCDNKKELDAQGNIITGDAEINSNFMVTKSSSSVIGEGLDRKRDKIEFEKTREEALKNKLKVMAHEFDQTDEENNRIKDEENNFEVVSFTDAQRNKFKVLGTELDTNTAEVTVILPKPRTVAQREAILNKQKVLGDEFHVPVKFAPKKEPANIAQVEAIENKIKILGSKDLDPLPISPRHEKNKRSELTLNLRPFNELTGISSTGEAVTPCDMFTGLDLETPTTADVVPQEGIVNSYTFTPQNENRFVEMEDQSKKYFLNTDGFNFSLIEDEDVAESDVIGDNITERSVVSSPSKEGDVCEQRLCKYSVFNILDGSYSLENFNPFGVKDLKCFSRDHFSSKMDLEASPISYTHPAIIMQEMKKKPYSNIFTTHINSEEEGKQKIHCDNIATLTACLQKSVLLPLTYQLEVVNNSVLSYFLVDLEMYEHLRSLKDYFFLMDGEFSRSICNNLFTRLSKTLNPADMLNFTTLHNILDKALGSSISHVHKFSENLSFTITESPLSFQHSSPDILQCLSLTYTVDWPLNIILSQEALLRYAKVFQFLVKMRRISWVLSEDFESMKLILKLSGANTRKLQRSPQYITLQLYRHILASLIRALDNYIVTTCILSSWTDFENDLKKARTLDDLFDCHVVYMKKVLFKCLLNNRSTPVMKLLNDIFTIILKFSRLLKAGEWLQKKPGGNFTHTSYAQLEELFHLYVKLVKYLHKVIMKLMECGYQRHLVELLTMFNLNGYYDYQKRDVKNDSSNANVN